MSYTVEELKVMLKKALATAKANRLNLEEVLENNLALREENATLRAEIAGLEARVGDQRALVAAARSSAHSNDITAGAMMQMNARQLKAERGY